VTNDHRNELITTLAWITGWSEEAFSRLSDEELQDRYNKMIEVEMEGQL